MTWIFCNTTVKYSNVESCVYFHEFLILGHKYLKAPGVGKNVSEKHVNSIFRVKVSLQAGHARYTCNLILRTLLSIHKTMWRQTPPHNPLKIITAEPTLVAIVICRGLNAVKCVNASDTSNNIKMSIASWAVGRMVFWGSPAALQTADMR